MLKINFSHELCPDKLWLDIRVDPSANLDALKTKIERHTGSDASDQRLVLYDPEGREVGPVVKDSLVNHGVTRDGYRIHVYDDNPESILRQLERDPFKYVLDEKKYKARKDTAREFLKTVRQKNNVIGESRQDNDVGDEPGGTNPQEEVEKRRHIEGQLKNKEIRCSVKATGIHGRVVWIGRISEGLSDRLRLVPGETLVGVLLPKELGVLHGEIRDEENILFTCNDDQSGALIPLQHIQLLHNEIPTNQPTDPMEL